MCFPGARCLGVRAEDKGKGEGYLPGVQLGGRAPIFAVWPFRFWSVAFELTAACFPRF